MQKERAGIDPSHRPAPEEDPWGGEDGDGFWKPGELEAAEEEEWLEQEAARRAYPA
ncbi:MAG TPA: hypothetical protein VMU01_03440 [Rhizomicrobium sp.]|nr:hypothetical protein [Rhizomicrobium sp.]